MQPAVPAHTLLSIPAVFQGYFRCSVIGEQQIWSKPCRSHLLYVRRLGPQQVEAGRACAPPENPLKHSWRCALVIWPIDSVPGPP